MKTVIEDRIKQLASKAGNANSALDAMQFAQAVLNLTQALCNLK